MTRSADVGRDLLIIARDPPAVAAPSECRGVLSLGAQTTLVGMAREVRASRCKVNLWISGR